MGNVNQNAIVSVKFQVGSALVNDKTRSRLINENKVDCISAYIINFVGILQKQT